MRFEMKVEVFHLNSHQPTTKEFKSRNLLYLIARILNLIPEWDISTITIVRKL